MILKMVRLGIITIIICFGVTGCMVNHKKTLKKPYEVTGAENLPTLTTSNSVSIIKEPLSNSDEVLLCEDFPHRWYATSKGLNDAAVHALEDIFIRNNIEVNQNGNRKLRLSVIETTCELGAFTVNHNVKIKVVGGSSIDKVFSGNQTAAHNTGVSWAVEKAIVAALLEMLKDPEMLNYLQK